VKPVEPARALGTIDDETGLLEQPEMPRYGGAADRQLIRQLLDGPVTGAQELDDGAPVGIAEGLERISGQCLQ
jgi:hypothetical protein